MRPPTLRTPLRALPAVLLPALPMVLCLVLVYALFRASPGGFVPHLTDEFNYWHQIATFTAHGWDGGHYTTEEHPAPASFTRFGVHGPLYIALYGTIGKVVGWHLGSAPVFNVILLAVAIALLVWIARPGLSRLGWVALVLAVSWPLHLFLPTNLQESVHNAVAIVLAPLVVQLLARRGETPRHLSAAAFALVAVAALMRPTWAILFVPLLPLAFGARRPGPAALAVGGAGVLIVGLGAVYGYIAAPFPQHITARVASAYAGDSVGAWGIVAGFVGDNLASLFSLQLDSDRHVLSTAQRAAVLLLVLFSLFRLARAGHARWRGEREGAGDAGFHFFHVANLGGVQLLSALLLPMQTFNDYRPVAPHLLLSLLVYALSGRRLVPLLYGAAYAALVLAFVGEYRTYHRPHFKADEEIYYSPEARRQYRGAVAAHVRYDPAAGPWDNSLVVDSWTYNRLLLGIEPGIGINRVFDWDRVDFPLKSRYVLIGLRSYPHVKDKPVHLQLVSISPFGNLYLNLDNPSVAAGAER